MGTLRAELRTELRVVQSRVDAVLGQIVDLNARVADQASRAVARGDLLLESQAEVLRLRNSLDELRTQLGAIRQAHEALEKAHEKLEKDHKRVLGVLQKNQLEPPSKRPRRENDKDEDAQRKT